MRTQVQFCRFASEELDNVLLLLAEKGKQYSDGRADALENFSVGATIMGLSPERYLMSLATKQWYVLSKYSSKPGNQDQDVIRSRAHDVIIYLLLLLFMLFYTEEGEVKNESILSGSG